MGLLHQPFWLQPVWHVWDISFQLLKILVWLRITDEGSVPEMRIWSIVLIQSDLKWCIHLSRSLFLYLFYIFAGLLYRIIPVVLLAVSTVTLAYMLRKRSRNIPNSYVWSNNNSRYRRMTFIIFIIMIIFLVAEIQDGIAFIIYAIEYSSNSTVQILTEDADNAWDTISTFLSMIGYACNFWIFFLTRRWPVQARSAATEFQDSPRH